MVRHQVKRPSHGIDSGVDDDQIAEQRDQRRPNRRPSRCARRSSGRPEEQRQPKDAQGRRADEEAARDEPFVGLPLRKLRLFGVLLERQPLRRGEPLDSAAAPMPAASRSFGRFTNPSRSSRLISNVRALEHRPTRATSFRTRIGFVRAVDSYKDAILVRYPLDYLGLLLIRVNCAVVDRLSNERLRSASARSS